MKSSPHILVIGLGNTLRGDDAAGRIAAERVRQEVDPHRVKVIDQPGPTPELAAEIAAAALTIFLDASVDGPHDGVLTRRVEATGTADALVHQLTPAGLLRLSEQLYGGHSEAYAVTIRGRTFGFEDCQLSPEVARQLDEAVRAVRELVENYLQKGNVSTNAPHG